LEDIIDAGTKEDLVNYVKGMEGGLNIVEWIAKE
jgi:hypothetical protein